MRGRGCRSSPEDYHEWTTRKLVANIRKMVRTDFGGRDAVTVASRRISKAGVGLNPVAAYLIGANDTRRGIIKRIRGATDELLRRAEKE